MKPTTEDQFRAELEEAKRALGAKGHDITIGDSSNDDDGISCDFELPYSSLPAIRTEKWL